MGEDIVHIVKRTIVNSIISTHIIPNRVRSRLLRLLGFNIQTNKIRAKCYFDSTNITIGKNSFVNYFCQFYPSEKSEIKIGQNCYLAMNVNICTISHEIGDSKQRARENEYHSITMCNVN